MLRSRRCWHEPGTSDEGARRPHRLGKEHDDRRKHNQYSFVVVPDAKKSEVKAAVELLFKVQVSSVQILNLKGKQKRFGRFMGKRNDVRKAYVSLAKDQEIKFEQEVM